MCNPCTTLDPVVVHYIYDICTCLFRFIYYYSMTILFSYPFTLAHSPLILPFALLTRWRFHPLSYTYPYSFLSIDSILDFDFYHGYFFLWWWLMIMVWFSIDMLVGVTLVRYWSLHSILLWLFVLGWGFGFGWDRGDPVTPKTKQKSIIYIYI